MAHQATFLRMLGFSVIAIGLTACGGKKAEEKAVEEYDEGDGFSIAKLIGSTKNPPDEFAVISTAPLEMPKDFAALPAPRPGARSALTPDPIAEARSVLLGETAPQAANARVSVSETALLSAAGTSTDPNIRSTLAVEQAQVDAGEDAYLLDRVFPSLRAYRGADLKDAIKPAEERVRLSDASGAQRAPTTGIASIPSGPAGNVVSQPVSATPSAPALPTVDPVTGGELIYIPE